jgi:uncharacterized phiE125 gp8 family phage protein
MILYSKAALPTTLPVTLAEAKLWLKIDGDDEDTLLTAAITAATVECEAYAGLSFITRTRTIKLTAFRGDLILPYGPVTALTSIEYVDSNGDAAEIDSADYTLDIDSGLAKVRILDSWPETNLELNNAVITYVAGYATPELVPPIIKLAIQKRLAFHYEKRGDEKAEQDPAWMDFLDAVKVVWSASYA